MEATQAFQRCMQKLLSRQAGCLSSRTTIAARRIGHRQRRRAIIHELSPRYITTSIVRFQSGPSDSAPNHRSPASVNEAGNVSSTKAPQQSKSKNETTSQPLRSRPERQDHGLNSIDLSSIATSPDYKPPPPRPQTTQEARDRATAQLDKLLGLRPRGQSKDNNNATQAPTEQQQQQPIYNNDIFGPKSSIFQPRRSGTPSSPTSPSQAPRGLPDISAMLEDLTLGSPNRPPREQPINLRLKPTLGRQVDVNIDRSVNVTRAFQLLEMKVNRNGNSVKGDERDQKFHVRRGQQRKIDRRRRWRVLFQQGFLAECGRIRKMIKQGW